MIKVNLLPQRKAKRGGGGGGSLEEGDAKVLFLGGGALAAAAAAVFFVVDMPKRSRLADIRKGNDALTAEIAERSAKLKGYEELKKAQEESIKRAEAIQRLISTKVVPAHLLHELGKVLTTSGPTMTEQMAKLAGAGPGSDPNKRFQPEWEPTHVWMMSFVDKDGVFRLEGGAQSESDVTQLSKRLAASVYFSDVTPAGGQRVFDKENGVNYYKFTITGKVAY
jgi:Tfp pilus assembly protein PilN